MSTTDHSLILPALILAPWLAAVLLPLLRVRQVQDGLAIGVTGLVLVGVVMLAPEVLQGALVNASLPGLLGSFNFALDPFALLFALFGSFVWFSAVLYATAYLRSDPHRVRLLSVLLVLLGAMLGVVLAADLLTLFVFFELLGLVALLVVVHSGSDEARAAGIQYFWMTFGGGLALLAGILLVLLQSDSLAWAPLPETVTGGWRWTIFGLLLVGFGVKAGMVPMHIWLPAAHPVAPAPASALLSGVMIKAGAYGLFRSLNMLLRPEAGAEAWNEVVDMGLVLALLGIVTLAVGVIMALLQNSIKRMLAWSSVSQMGFVLTGLGVGAFLAADGAMATAGALLHVLNHALFKSCLFLAAGAIAIKCGTAEMDRLGGLWRQMPLTFVLVLVAAAGIAGLPLFNGFVSKSMIHHALVEAGQHDGTRILIVAEWVYIAAAAGTVAYFSKFIFMVFIRKAPEAAPIPVREADAVMLAGMLLPALGVVWLGWRPQDVLLPVLAPGLTVWGMADEPIADYLSRYFLSAGDALTAAGTVAAGLALLGIGLKLGLFRRQPPAMLGMDYWYRWTGRSLIDACRGLAAWAAHLRQGLPALVRIVHVRVIHPLWESGPLLRRRAWHGLLLALRGGSDLALQGGMLRRRMWRDLLLRLRDAAEFLIDTTVRDHIRPESAHPESTVLASDKLYATLDLQRDRLILSADRLARQRGQDRPGDALINASHMLAGWIGTELLEHAMLSGNPQTRQLAQSEDLCLELADRAVTLALQHLDGTLQEAQLEQLSEELKNRLAPEGERPLTVWPERSWPAEITAIALAPHSGHWPVSESMEQGAFVSAARGRIMKVASDLSSGLLVAFALLLLIAAGAYWLSLA